jgi:hypothetical protein
MALKLIRELSLGSCSGWGSSQALSLSSRIQDILSNNDWEPSLIVYSYFFTFWARIFMEQSGAVVNENLTGPKCLTQAVEAMKLSRQVIRPQHLTDNIVRFVLLEQRDQMLGNNFLSQFGLSSVIQRMADQLLRPIYQLSHDLAHSLSPCFIEDSMKDSWGGYLDTMPEWLNSCTAMVSDPLCP